jgi:23S rRNA C2498 (ribose-2'-O)-methylase RlmM
MGAGKHIKTAMIDKGLKAGEVAERLGDNPQVFYNKMSRDSFKYAEAERIADALGCDIVLRDRETGKIY